MATLAGSGWAGFQDGPAATAKFNNPRALAIDSSGTIYVADRDNHRIRVISGGTVTTLAGSGAKGFVDGPAATAQFSYPSGVAVDSSSGKVYVSDSVNYRIRLISGGQVTTFAGSGANGSTDGPALSAKFSSMSGLALDGASKLYVADGGNDLIRLIAGGQVSKVAGLVHGFQDGPALAAKFIAPAGLAVTATGEIYIADQQRIRMLSSGQVSTVAGNGTIGFADGPAAYAKFSVTTGLALDASGKLYIADTQNHRIRLLSSGQVTTVAGAGVAGFADGPALKAKFNLPWDMVMDSSGKIYIADKGNHRIRVYTP